MKTASGTIPNTAPLNPPRPAVTKAVTKAVTEPAATKPVSVVQLSGCDQAVAIAKALGDDTRLRIMALLKNQELCACQIIEAFELANSTISRHLTLLKQAGLLHSRKSGRWVYYAWSASESPIVQLSQNWVIQVSQHDDRFQADRENMTQILKIDPEVLCRRQSGKNCC